jgi:hypothetical protein
MVLEGIAETNAECAAIVSVDQELPRLKAPVPNQVDSVLHRFVDFLQLTFILDDSLHYLFECRHLC